MNYLGLALLLTCETFGGKMQRQLSALLVALLFVSLSAISAPAQEAINGVEILEAKWQGEDIEYLDREILVMLKPGVTQDEFAAKLAPYNVEIVRDADRFGFLKLVAGSRDAHFDLIETIDRMDVTRYAEPNMVDRLYLTPDDPRFDEQWHYHNTGQVPPGGTPDADIDAPEGWDISTGGAVIRVGVLDSGIPIEAGQLSHEDLDDPTRYFFGYDFSNGDTEPKDDNGHGTHVSGTIAAESDNGTGVAGVCWNAEILAIKVFDANGSGSHENFRDGCIYAVDNGCRVINYSGGGSESATKEHGVAYADTNNVVVCAAAGNNWQGSVSWPGAYAADYDNVICVSSVDHNDQSSPFSSIGPSVTVSAPGGYGSPFDSDDILSTYPNYPVTITTDYGLPLNYGPLAGTSMATPHVTGFAALILSMNPGLSADSVRQIMVNTSDDLGPAGFDNQFGWGRINVYNALSQMGAIVISHSPLTDTRDTLVDYEVLCQIYADTTLVSDSILLRYEIDAIDYTEVLVPTGGLNQYNAYIPAQSPGTVIDYSLFAKTVAGDTDSTDVYSFRVIDYEAELTTLIEQQSGGVDDTLWYDLTVTNTGVLDDTYDLTVTGNVWQTTIYDYLGQNEITQTPNLLMDESFDFKVSVIIPSSQYGDTDTATVAAISTGDPSISSELNLRTTSVGEPWDIPFVDNFPSTTIDIGKWVIVDGAEANDIGLEEPSYPYSLNLNGDPSGGDQVTSQAIDLDGQANALVRYYYQQTGGGESPDAGDDLVVSYFNNAGIWLPLNTHLGDGPDMTEYAEVEINLPADALHGAFAIRFECSATSGAYDDWFIDDVYVGPPPQFDLSVSPSEVESYGAAGDTAVHSIYVINDGLQTDTYSLADSAASWPVSFWDQTGTTQITETDPVSPGDSIKVVVKVEVPGATPFGDNDVAWVKATSVGDAFVEDRALVTSISNGPIGQFPWFDNFPDATLDDLKWTFRVGAHLVTEAPNPPSPPYTLNMDGGNDTLVSQTIDMSALENAWFFYAFQRGGVGDSPENGDDLVFEFRSSVGEWVELSRQEGGLPNTGDFEIVSISLPGAFLHGQFQFRILSFGSGAGQDDWYVDDINIDYAPAITVIPSSFNYTLPIGDSTTGEVVIDNGGPGMLWYNVNVVPEINPLSTIGQLIASGNVAPATYEVDQSAFDVEPVKGVSAGPPGMDVVFDAGGPDTYGHLWIDSDESGGPEFDWIDIQATGTEILGLTDDNYVGPFDIGFSFEYYGTEYVEFWVGSNGIIGFGDTANYKSYLKDVLPNPTTPNNILAWCWDDLNILDGNNPDGKVLYEQQGDMTVIQFVDYPKYNAAPGEVINAEVILYKDGKIKYQYDTIGDGFEKDDCTVGIENVDGSDGLTVVYKADYLHDSLAVLFTNPMGWIDMTLESGYLAALEADTLPFSIVTEGMDVGTYSANIKVVSNDPDPGESLIEAPIDLTIEEAYTCGDVNDDESIDVDDIVFLINYVFNSGPAPAVIESADVDCSGGVDIDDITYLIAHVFQGGPDPCASCP